jgi:hypothetical protein
MTLKQKYIDVAEHERWRLSTNIQCLEGKEYERLFGLMLKHKYIDVNEHERLQFDTWTQIKVKEQRLCCFSVFHSHRGVVNNEHFSHPEMSCWVILLTFVSKRYSRCFDSDTVDPIIFLKLAVSSLNNVIIIKIKLHFLQAYVSLAYYCYPASVFLVSCS